MAIAVDGAVPSRQSDWLSENLPKIVLAPTFVITLFFVYGFILWTTFLSFTKSRFMPVLQLDGLRAYERLWANPNWWTSLENLAIFGILYIGLATAIGLLLAILLDQKIRGEGVLRTIYLYPMALSFIVTGTAWKWLLNPGIGIQKLVQDWGFTSFTLDWITQPSTAIYCIVIAAIWQSSGFVMAMFLAGLRGVDGEIVKAAQIDGASTFKIYWRIIIPLMRPVFLSSFVILSHLAIKSLRPGRGPDRRRPGHSHLAAGDLHVQDDLHPQRGGAGCRLGGDDADDGGRNHGALPLFRAAAGGEERPWLTLPPPSPARAAPTGCASCSG